MKTEEIEYLNGEFKVSEQVPSTVEELTSLIGESAVVEEATGNLYYRNKYPRVYKAVSKAVEAEFPRAKIDTKQLKDGTTRDILEAPMDHLRAFLNGRKDNGNGGSPAPEGSRDRLQALFTEIASAQPLYVKGERTGGGGKIGQAAMNTANEFIAAGPERVEAVATAIESIIPGYKVGRDADGDVTPESLARGIQALGQFQQKKAQTEAMNALKAAGV